MASSTSAVLDQPAIAIPAGARDAAAEPRGVVRRRLVFANQLRGLAAFSVMQSHLLGLFWAAPAIVSAATATPPQSGAVPSLYWIFAHKWFNGGPFGVAVFFLISGLVIPISLEHHSRLGFILARLLRIFPTYLCALALTLLVLWANTRYWGRTLDANFGTIKANAFLVQDFFDERSLDSVNWTLSVELKFYVIVALFATSIKAGSTAVLFAIAFGALAATLSANLPMFQPLDSLCPGLSSVVLTEAPYLVFMLIGVLFNYRLRGLVSPLGFIGCGAGMCFIFVACWRGSALVDQYPVVVVNYAYALGLFGLLFVLRARIPASRVLDALAAISFPAYLAHPILGYSMLRFMMIVWGFGYYLALAITLPVIVALATLLHVTVERWSIAAGKRLAGRG